MSVMHVYGSDTGSVILIEGHKLKLFGETVLRNIFGPESNGGGTAGWGAAFVTKC